MDGEPITFCTPLSKKGGTLRRINRSTFLEKEARMNTKKNKFNAKNRNEIYQTKTLLKIDLKKLHAFCFRVVFIKKYDELQILFLQLFSSYTFIEKKVCSDSLR